MRSIKSFILLAAIGFSGLSLARINLPRFAAKQTVENIRFMTLDGRYTYSQKRSGGLTMSTSFKSTDVMNNPAGTNYHISSSEARKKMVVEVEFSWHQDMDLNKLHDIYVGNFAGTQFAKVGRGRNARLHLDDEWLTWFDPKDKAIHVQLLRSPDRHQIIRLGKKHNGFFFPEVSMLNPETVLYSDINDKGFAALLSWNMVDKRMTIIRKSEVSGTRLEMCRRGNMFAIGEFSYDDANRGSTIMFQRWANSPTIDGFTTVYRASDNDIGQMICGQDKIWFVKTMSEDRKLNIRQTEAALMELPSGRITVRSDLEKVTNIIEMDGRVLLPMREDIFVLEGDAGSGSDTLQAPAPRRAQ